MFSYPVAIPMEILEAVRAFDMHKGAFQSLQTQLVCVDFL
jgi:hypothetical protein